MPNESHATSSLAKGKGTPQFRGRVALATGARFPSSIKNSLPLPPSLCSKVRSRRTILCIEKTAMRHRRDDDDDDDVYNYVGERLKLEGETENMGVCT